LFFIITGVIGLGIQQIFYLESFQLLPASQIVIVFYLYSLLMIILAGLILTEKTSLLPIYFVLLGFFGVYVLASNGTFIKLEINTGLIVTLLASLSWGLFSVLIKLRKINAEISMFLFNLFGLVFLISLVPLFGLNYFITLTENFGILYLVLTDTYGTCICFVEQSTAVNNNKLLLQYFIINSFFFFSNNFSCF